MGASRGERIYSLDEQQDMIKNINENEYLPLKYNYFGYGTKRWIRFTERWLNIWKADPGARGIHVFERNLVMDMAKSIFDALPPNRYKNLNLIDLGCGDGSPMYPVIRYIQMTMPKAKIRYNPIDLSHGMLKASSRNIARDFKVFGKQNKWDLERGSFEKITKGLNAPNFGNLYLFLGATFGNMYDTVKVLSDIRKSMLSEDYLLLAVELVVEKQIGQMVQEYYGIREIYDLLFTTFESFGLKRSSGAFRVTFNRELNRIEEYYIPERDINFKTRAGKIILEKDKPILLAISIKFTTNMFVEIIQKAGFGIQLLTTSEGENYAIALLRPVK